MLAPLQSTSNQFNYLNVRLQIEDILKSNAQSAQLSALEAKSESAEESQFGDMLSDMLFTSTELDPEVARLTQFYVSTECPVYLLDYTFTELNTTAFSLRFGDIKVDPLLQNTRRPLGAMMLGLSAAVAGSLIGLPPPLNWIAALALGGPLFASTYGFITQNN